MSTSRTKLRRRSGAGSIVSLETKNIKISIVPEVGSSKSGIWPIFGNSAKSGQISSQIPVQLQYGQSIMDKTNAADLVSCVFAISMSITRTIET